KQVPHNTPQVIQPEADGTLRLVAPKAELYGRTGDGTIAIYDGQMCIGWWTSQEDYAIWQVEAARDGAYDVYLHWAITDDWAENPFVIEAGESRLTGAIPTTGGFDRYELRKFGRLQLKQGRNQVAMKPTAKVKGELADLKEIRLVPAEAAPPDAHPSAA